MELAIAIGVDIVLGLVLLWLFTRVHSRETVLANADEALRIFRQRFPDAVGAATVASGWRPGGLGHTTAALRAADSARRERGAMLGASGAT